LKLLDIFLLLILIWGGYSGYRRGLVVEGFSIFSFSIAKILSLKALHIFKAISGKVNGSTPTIASYVFFGLIFIVIVAILIILSRYFRSKVNKTVLGKVDKTLGSILGVGKWAFYASTALWVANLLHIGLPDSYIGNSFLLPIIKSISPSFISWVSKWIPALRTLIEIVK
jgi:membrane protein required for colicin V production